MLVTARIDQLRRNPQLVPVTANAAFEDEVDAEHRGNLGETLVGLAKGKRRRPGDDPELGDSGQVIQDFLGNAVGEILPVGCFGHVSESEHGNRRPARIGRHGHRCLTRGDRPKSCCNRDEHYCHCRPGPSSRAAAAGRRHGSGRDVLKLLGGSFLDRCLEDEAASRDRA